MRRENNETIRAGLALAAGVGLTFAVGVRAEPLPDFGRDIRPILSANCFKCHGPDEKARKGGKHGVRLDIPDGAYDNNDGHPPIVPGHPERSELVKRITAADPDDVMPPVKTGKKLTPQEIVLLQSWIKHGAKYAKHWAYVPPVRPPLPVVRNKAWPRNPIDVFLLARLEKEKLAPSPEADRYTLIRRVTLDLIGLPPTIAEVDQFIADKRPDAYERLVDRLLQSPAYGEHWARSWLDLARYADSAGYADDPMRTIWGYRDYVIRAFNENVPFDQFTIEQLAGDLLEKPTDAQLIATAFHRNTMTNNEGGTNDEEFRNVAIVDRVNTTMSVWMGTSIACAQCHDHKYDPLTQKEYFRLFAFLNNTADADRSDESPVLSVYSDEQKQQRSQWESEIAALEKKLKTPTPALLAAQTQWEQSFPTNLPWVSLKPASVKSQGGAAVTLQDDGAVQVAPGQKTDVYTIEVPVTTPRLTALRLETLPPDENFVVSRVRASVVPQAENRLTGRFVRVELPGKEKYLHLAEVQVFSGNDNIALRGEASQISTDFGGDAKRAIDGNTEGDYNKANSVSHTALAENPWWEVDLKTPQPIDRIVVWNRTDGSTEERIRGWRLVVLDDKHQVIWQQDAKEPPKPSATFSTNGTRAIPFASAFADAAQAGANVAAVIGDSNDKNAGWVVGAGAVPRALTLVATAPVELPAGAKLVVTIEQSSSNAARVLGHFRLAATDDARVAEFARLPSEVVAALAVGADKRDERQRALLTDYFMKSVATELKPDREKLASVKKQLAELKPNTVPIMRELAANQRRKTNIQLRGNYKSLADEVTEGVPAAWPPLPAGAPLNRLTLAKWIVDPGNPLTARVIANRFWEQLFGIGLVRTSEEFGAQGEQPFHPELLDWLATELVREKWDLKQFLKLLVTSAAYRQSSRVTPALQERDPENRMLARGPRFRMSAEMVRDQALAVSGLLSRRMYGPSVKPPRPSAGLSAAFGGGLDWETSKGEDKYRRALYTEWRRTSPYPSMTTFDAPNREVCTLRRNRTNTPLQALVTLNDPVYIEASQALARRMAQAPVAPVTDKPKQPGTAPANSAQIADKARFGFRLCLARPPREPEVARLVALYNTARAGFATANDKAVQLATNPLGPVPDGTDAADLAAWTTVANVLLNLDETVMKR